MRKPVTSVLAAAALATGLCAIAQPAAALCTFLPFPIGVGQVYCTAPIISQGNPPASPPNRGRGDQGPRR